MKPGKSFGPPRRKAAGTRQLSVPDQILQSKMRETGAMHSQAAHFNISVGEVRSKLEWDDLKRFNDICDKIGETNAAGLFGGEIGKKIIDWKKINTAAEKMEIKLKERSRSRKYTSRDIRF